MYVIYSHINGAVQMIAWTSSLKIAKDKLNEYAIKYMDDVDGGDNGDATLSPSQPHSIKSSLEPPTDQLSNITATMIYGIANRHRGNIAQINISTLQTTGSSFISWYSRAQVMQVIGYFAISRVNQVCNLYPEDSAESAEISKDLELERVMVGAAIDTTTR
jgi:hypothetical protein